MEKTKIFLVLSKIYYPKSKSMEEKEIGKITHYYTNIGVGIIELNDTLKLGETIHIKGASTDFEQIVESMQIEHKKIKKAKKEDVIGLKVDQQVRVNDVVYKVPVPGSSKSEVGVE